MTVPDVIERRECPECGDDVRGCHCTAARALVSRRYVAVDALLRDDVVEAAAREMGIVKYFPPSALQRHEARAALAAAVKHLTGA